MSVRTVLATAGGLGRVRRGPGTVASAATCLAAWPLLGRGAPLPVAAVLATVVGLLALRRFPGIEQDPGAVVIDEVAGQLVALLPLARARPSPGRVLAAFALFRLFDIVKPGPVGALDRRKGSVGVMGDDLIAGGLAAVLVASAGRR